MLVHFVLSAVEGVGFPDWLLVALEASEFDKLVSTAGSLLAPLGEVAEVSGERCGAVDDAVVRRPGAELLRTEKCLLI